uniref:Uncharacterized protein n=1 Tax=Leersia perrieri TaxID=77586 RepID=A0A0D9VBN1_9ORYZ
MAATALRIPPILFPDGTSAAYSTCVVNKIEEMRTIPLTKDALQALQRAEEKAKTHHKFMHKHDIERY